MSSMGSKLILLFSYRNRILNLVPHDGIYIHLWLVAVPGASKFPQMNQIGGVKVDLNGDTNKERNIQTVLTLILPAFGIL